MVIKILGNRLLVKPLKEDEVSKGGIILPDTVDKERPEQGHVIEIGECTEVNVGDKILFKKYNADNLQIEKEDYLIMDEDDVIGKIE